MTKFKLNIFQLNAFLKIAKHFTFLFLYFVCHLNLISVAHNPDYPWTMKLSGGLLHLTRKAFIQVKATVLQVSENPLSGRMGSVRYGIAGS